MPILKKYDLPYTVYLAPGLIEGTADLWWEAIERVVRQQDRLMIQIPGMGMGPTELDCSNLLQKADTFQFLLDYLTNEVSEEDQRQGGSRTVLDLQDRRRRFDEKRNHELATGGKFKSRSKLHDWCPYIETSGSGPAGSGRGPRRGDQRLRQFLKLKPASAPSILPIPMAIEKPPVIATLSCSQAWVSRRQSRQEVA